MENTVFRSVILILDDRRWAATIQSADFRLIPILSNVSRISRNYTVDILISKPTTLDLSILTLQDELGELWRRESTETSFFTNFELNTRSIFRM